MKIALIVFTLVLASSGESRLEGQRMSLDQHLASMEGYAANFPLEPKAEDFIRVMRLVVAARIRQPYETDRQFERSVELQKFFNEHVASREDHLISIRDFIMDLSMQAESPKYGGDSSFYSYLDRSRRKAFMALRYRQSSEAIGILMSFLDDRRGETKETLFPGQLLEPSEYYSMSSAFAALNHLSRANIREFPAKYNEYQFKLSPNAVELADVEIQKAKRWWEEVVSGQRTFQFVNDPLHYNHLGPAEKEIKFAGEHRRIVRSSGKAAKKNEEPRSEIPPDSKGADPRKTWWIYVIIGLGALGGFFYLRQSGRNS